MHVALVLAALSQQVPPPPRPAPDTTAGQPPAASFTIAAATVRGPLRWRGAALEAFVSAQVTARGPAAPGATLLHLVVAGDTLTADRVLLAQVGVPVTAAWVMDLGSLSRAALAHERAAMVLVMPGRAFQYAVDLGVARVLALLDGPVQLAEWRGAPKVLESRVVIPAAFAGLALDLRTGEFGPDAGYSVNGRAVPWHAGSVALCGPCREGEALLVRVEPDSQRPATEPPVARVRDRTYTDLARNWTLLAGLGRSAGPPPDASAWLRAAMDPSKGAYRALAQLDAARLEEAGADLRGDTVYLVGHVPVADDLPERSWRAALAEQLRSPGATFAAGGARWYGLVGARAPGLLDSIRTAVRRGAWAPTGGSWAETDPGGASGERLVRQGLYGQLELQRLFDRRSSVGWVPAHLSLPWTAPQIWRGLGFERVVVAGGAGRGGAPEGSFIWEGRDGTRLFGYHAMNHTLDDDAFAGILARRATLGARSELALYGGEDTGGTTLGAVRRRVEELRRLPAFAAVVDALPGQALRAVERRSGAPPVWRDGLPGEATPPARHTARRAESLVRATEVLATLDTVPYPREELERAWRLLLAGIRGDDSLWTALRARRDEALRRVARRLDTRGRGVPIVVFNPSSWVRSSYVTLAADARFLRGRRGRPIRVVDAARRATPVLVDGDSLRFFAREMPPLGIKVFWFEIGAPPPGGIAAAAARIENDFLTVEVDTVTGRLLQLYDKQRDRAVLGAGGARLEGEGIGPVRAVRRGGAGPERWIELEHPWAGGRVVQRVVLRRDEPFALITGCAEGRGAGTPIQAALQLDAGADTVWYGLPYGAAARPGALEHAGRLRGRWVDVSGVEVGSGVLADGIEGWEVRGREVVMTLLTAPAAATITPDSQVFGYALYPHAGDWRGGGTARRAAELAAPLVGLRVSEHRGPAGHAWSFLTLDADNVTVGAVKQAELGRSAVVRLVEGHGRAARVTLTFGGRVARVRTATLLEDPVAIVAPGPDGSVTLALGPWEIVTLLIDEGP